MLKKLIKQDFRALSRILVPVQIGVLCGSLLAAVLMTITLRTAIFQTDPVTVGEGLFAGMSAIIVVLIGMAVMASWLVALLVVCMHFFKNFLGDQGYLTFTLPVGTGELIWSKLITGMLWLVISGAVICVSSVIVLTFGTVAAGVMNVELIKDICSVFSGAARYVSLLTAVELPVAGVLQLAAFLLELYFAMIVGSQIAKKHKVLAGIGMYLVINFVVGIVRSLLTVAGYGMNGINFVLNGELNATAVANATLLITIVISAVLSVGFFLWSRHLLKTRLNLQ